MTRIRYKGKDLLPVKSDIVFKAVFISDSGLDLLASLLSSILSLDLKAEDLTIANTELVPAHENGKLSRVDIRVRTADGKHINVEIQLINEHDMDKRSIFYLSKIYVEQMSAGMKFETICPVIAINIVDFAFLPFEEYHNQYRLMNTRNNHELTDVLEINFIELPKTKTESAKGLKDLWMKFLTAESEEVLDMLANENPVFEKAVKRLIYVSADEQLRYEMYMKEKAELDYGSAIATAIDKGREEGIQKGREEGIQKGREEGIQKGREEGIQKGILKAARMMLKGGQSPEEIAQMLGITIDEIKNID